MRKNAKRYYGWGMIPSRNYPKCQAGEKSVGKVSNQQFSWLVNSPVSEVSVELLSLGELPQEQYQLEKFLVGKRSYNLFSCIWERQSKRVINTT